MNPSIVDYLNSQGQASDYSSRAKLAQSKGIANYTGTAEQNTSLLNMLKTPTPTTPKPTTTTQSMGNQATAPYITPPSSSNPTLPSSQTSNNSMSTINNQLSSPGITQISGPTMPTTSNTTQNTTQPTSTPAPTNKYYAGNSVVDYLSSLGLNNDFNSRTALANKYGIQGYTGTAEQNTQLLQRLRGEPQDDLANNNTTLKSTSNPNVMTMPSSGVIPGTTQVGATPPVDIKAFNEQMIAGNKSGALDMNKLTTSTGLSAPIGSNTAVQGLVNQLLSKGNNPQGTTPNTTSQGNNTTSITSPYLNVSPSSQNTPASTTTPQNATATAQPYNAYGGLIAQLIQQTQMGAKEKALRDQQSQLQLDLADRVGAEASNPIPLEFQTGRISALQNLAAQRDKAISSQIANEQKQREIAGQALGAGVTAMAPVQVAPQNTYINPATGQVVANPNYQNLTNYSQATQNIKIGQDAQTEAARLNTTLNQMKAITPTITNFMQQAGINPFDIQLMNSPMNSYKQFIDNPANATSFNAMMADVKTYTAQILGSSGLNPTEVSATINSFDPSSLSPVQLKAFLDNLDNLGQIRLKPLQDTMNQAYGQNSTLGAFAGQQAHINPNSVTLPNNNVVNPLTGEPMGVMGQLGAGTALQSGAGILQLIQALGGR